MATFETSGLADIGSHAERVNSSHRNTKIILRAATAEGKERMNKNEFIVCASW